jgi:hypothetical protein
MVTFFLFVVCSTCMVDIIMIPTYTFIFRLLFLALFCHTRAHAGLNQLGGILAMEVCHAWCYFELYDNPYACYNLLCL